VIRATREVKEVKEREGINPSPQPPRAAVVLSAAGLFNEKVTDFIFAKKWGAKKHGSE
jgi:hypothetical protein